MKLEIAKWELQTLLNLKFTLDKKGRSSYEYDARIKELRSFLDSKDDKEDDKTINLEENALKFKNLI